MECFAKVALQKVSFCEDVLYQIFDHPSRNDFRELQYLFNMQARSNLHANKRRLCSCYYECMLITDINLARAKCNEFSLGKHYALFQVFVGYCEKTCHLCVIRELACKVNESEELTSNPNVL